MQQAGTAGVNMDSMEFGRRLATEREIGALKGGQASTANAGKIKPFFYIIFEFYNLINREI